MACFLSLQASRSPAWLHLEDVLVTRWTPVPALSGVRSVWFSFKNAASQQAGSLREDPRGPAEAAVGLVKARGLVSSHLRRALLEARLTGGARRSLPRGPFDGQRLPAPCEPPPRAQRLSSCPHAALHCRTRAHRMWDPGPPTLHSSLLLLACFARGLGKAHAPAPVSRGSVGFPCFPRPGFKSGHGQKPRTSVRPRLPPVSTAALAVAGPRPKGAASRVLFRFVAL